VKGIDAVGQLGDASASAGQTNAKTNFKQPGRWTCTRSCRWVKPAGRGRPSDSGSGRGLLSRVAKAAGRARNGGSRGQDRTPDLNGNVPDELRRRGRKGKVAGRQSQPNAAQRRWTMSVLQQTHRPQGGCRSGRLTGWAPKRRVCRETEGDVSAWVLQRPGKNRSASARKCVSLDGAAGNKRMDGLCRRRRDWRRADSVLSRSGYWGRTDR
jgi:hypothetical protein